MKYLGDIVIRDGRPLDIDWLKAKVDDGYTIHSAHRIDNVYEGRGTCLTLVKVR